MERDESLDLDFRKAAIRYVKEGGRGAQKRLSEKAGVSQSSICDIRKGVRYGSEHYRTAIAKAAGFSSLDEFRSFGRGTSSAHVLPFARRKTDDPELSPIIEKIAETWIKIKGDPGEKAYMLRALQAVYNDLRPRW